MGAKDHEIRLKALLAACHVWPHAYTYKFIVEKAHLAAVAALFPGETPVIRPSAKGAYVSVTFTVLTANPDDVLEVYERASKIAGIISL